jgi:hypothetical protein
VEKLDGQKIRMLHQAQLFRRCITIEAIKFASCSLVSHPIAGAGEEFEFFEIRALGTSLLEHAKIHLLEILYPQEYGQHLTIQTPSHERVLLCSPLAASNRGHACHMGLGVHERSLCAPLEIERLMWSLLINA